MTMIIDLKNATNQTMLVAPGLFALVSKVLDRKVGNGNYGEWSMQPLTLRDNSGEINAIVWGKPDLAGLAGKEIHLAAVNSGKGWSGCMVEDRSYTDKAGNKKSSRQIKASGEFLLEECQPTALPIAPGQPGYPTSPPESPTNGTQQAVQRVSLPKWDEYLAVVRSAHHLALQLEPDTQMEPNEPPRDRSRARLALVSTILIAYGKRDFSFEPQEPDPNEIPF